MIDNKNADLIAEARALTECHCVTEAQQECGKDGDHISRLIANLADALEVATRSEAVVKAEAEWEYQCRLSALADVQRPWTDVEPDHNCGHEMRRRQVGAWVPVSLPSQERNK
jgi:hypothetical protein